MAIRDEFDDTLIKMGLRSVLDGRTSQPERLEIPLTNKDGKKPPKDVGSLIDALATYERPLTTKEVAKLLNVSPLSVQRKAKRGTIPAFKVGRLFRYDPKALAVWARKRGVL